MIDWQSVFFNSFWIVGAAILLAAVSYFYWLAQEMETAVKQQFETNGFQRFFWISFSLIGVGLIGTSHAGWEMGVWGLFTVISGINCWRTWQVPKRPLSEQE